MRNFHIPYRTRRLLQRSSIVLLVVTLVAALVFLCWFVWLKRYVVYTRDQGAVLDMQLSAQIPEGNVAIPPEEKDPVNIYYNEGENAINTSKELTHIVGYYADTKAWEAGVDQVLQQALALPTGTPVMLDVKSAKGNFYYSSAVSETRSSNVDTQAMDELIAWLKKSGMYTIACVPALRDREYGLHHTGDGIHHSSRGYLWMDDMGCYWLNPMSGGTLNYLTQTVNELKALGFHEVLLSDFSIPVSNNIYFDGDRSQALTSAANTIVTSCATGSFTVSFMGSTSFTLPEGRCRLYMENVEPSGINSAVEASGVSDPLIQLVFLTTLYDTRFEKYSALRPLSSAH